MANKDAYEPESKPVDITYVSGLNVTMEGTNVVVTSWQMIDGERRIVHRAAASLAVARKFQDDLTQLLGRYDATT